MKRIVRHIAGFAVILVAGLVFAQQSTDGPFILHEHVSGWQDRTGSGNGDGSGNEAASSDAEEGGESAEANEFGDVGEGEAPALSMETRDDELVYGKDGPVPDGRFDEPYGSLNPFSSANTLDENTDRVNSLKYFASFEPSVIPYKRVVAQNRVMHSGGDYRMVLEAGSREPVEVEPFVGVDEELFWGNFMIRMERDQWQPLASVSPSQRIVEVHAEPPVDLRFSRDNAGNFFVRSDQRGMVRLVVKIAVDPYYFSGEFGDVDWGSFTRLDKPEFPQSARASARAVLATLGVSTEMRPAEVMYSMVEYFRDFEGRAFPDELKGQGDLYETIAREKIGVCRHRSLAFVITAQYLGIPARYVYNEAHAFAEIEWPGQGWRRVDLGGAADELNAASDGNRSVHTPEDTLPRPQRFLDEQERMETQGWEPDSGSTQGGDSESDSDRTSGEDQAEELGEQQGEDLAQSDASDSMGESEGLSESASDASESPPDARRRTRVRILDGSTEVKRGAPFRLVGQLDDADGNGLAFRNVEVHLGPVGRSRPRPSTRIAVVETDARGRVDVAIEIPRSQSIGRWSLFLAFPGDESHRASVGE